MERYWENASGYYDPTATKAIKRENAEAKKKKIQKARNKLVHNTIQEIKSILESRDLELVGRIVIRDKKTNKKYK